MKGNFSYRVGYNSDNITMGYDVKSQRNRWKTSELRVAVLFNCVCVGVVQGNTLILDSLRLDSFYINIFRQHS